MGPRAWLVSTGSQGSWVRVLVAGAWPFPEMHLHSAHYSRSWACHSLALRLSLHSLPAPASWARPGLIFSPQSHGVLLPSARGHALPARGPEAGDYPRLRGKEVHGAGPVQDGPGPHQVSKASGENPDPLAAPLSAQSFIRLGLCQ